MNILIIDDIKIIRFELIRLLNEVFGNVTIMEAESLDDAVSILAREEVSLTFFDMHMPGADSFEKMIPLLIEETQIFIFSRFKKSWEVIKELADTGFLNFL